MDIFVAVSLLLPFLVFNRQIRRILVIKQIPVDISVLMDRQSAGRSCRTLRCVCVHCAVAVAAEVIERSQRIALLGSGPRDI
jgi:hypothetical protein